VHVVGAHVGERATPPVLKLDLRHMAGTRWASRVTATQRLQLRLLVSGDHELVGAQRLAVPQAGIEIQDSGCLGSEVGVAGEDP